jgi:2-desacetyl-2-hydroxyethyl bacteriochlorophyllide A dehydrogenase
MKAVKVLDGKPQLVELAKPIGNQVLVKVATASICGSDLHMIEKGYFGDHVIGHEFAGYAPDGRAVAVEPTVGCGLCHWCEDGHNSHCQSGMSILGVFCDGGMAEYVLAPARNLVELPTGLEIGTAAMVEPLAVAFHGLDRFRLQSVDRVLVIGAGPIGLAAVAAMQARGIHCDISARYPHQLAASEQLGAGIAPSGHYDVVIDAVGSTASLEQAINELRPMGRIGLLGSFWDPASLNVGFCMKEAELIAATTYNCKSPRRNFEEAGRLLQANPVVARQMISHRFPLEGVAEAFATAADRSSGAVKVVFDIS